MINPNQLEESYKEFTTNLTKWVPDGVINVNLNLLHELGLLSTSQFEESSADSLMHYFHVIETDDKVTLFNEQFAIWIVPQIIENKPSTLTLIALLQNN
ncbi:MAG: hypothetical protein ACM3JI_00085, partial [Anaerolineae bacterium]